MAEFLGSDEVTNVKREVTDLKCCLALIEVFVDNTHREKLGLRLDPIRAIWFVKRVLSAARIPLEIRCGVISAG
jgi:hypothetical protein